MLNENIWEKENKIIEWSDFIGTSWAQRFPEALVEQYDSKREK